MKTFKEFMNESIFTPNLKFSVRVFKNGVDTKRPGDIFELIDSDYKDDFKDASDFASKIQEYFKKGDNSVSTFLENVLTDDFKLDSFYKKYKPGDKRLEYEPGVNIVYKIKFKNSKDYILVLQ